MIEGYLVYTEHNGHVSPEKWPTDAPSGVTEGRTIVARHKLNAEEFSQSLTTLEFQYPPPPPKEVQP